MNSLASEDKLVFDKLCSDILSLPEIRFAGIINYLGRQVAGGYGKGITPLVDEEQHKMCLENTLELVMTKDLDNSLGSVSHISTQRQSVLMLTIPLGTMILLISVIPQAKSDEILEQIMPRIKKLSLKLNESSLLNT